MSTMQERFNDTMDYMVELKVGEVEAIVAASEEGRKLKTEIDSLVTVLKNTLDNKELVKVLRLQEVFRMYTREIAENSYRLGLCDAINSFE